MKITTTSKPEGYKIAKDSGESVQAVFLTSVCTAVEVELAGKKIEIKPKKLLPPIFEIFKDNTLVGKIETYSSDSGNGGGFMGVLKSLFTSTNRFVLELNADDSSPSQRFLLETRKRNTWFELKDEQDAILIKLKRNFRILKLQAEYQVETMAFPGAEQRQLEMLIYLVFWAEYYSTKNPGTSGG